MRSLHSSGFAWPRLLLRLDGLNGGEFEPVVVGEVYVFWLEAALPLPSPYTSPGRWRLPCSPGPSVIIRSERPHPMGRDAARPAL